MFCTKKSLWDPVPPCERQEKEEEAAVERRFFKCSAMDRRVYEEQLWRGEELEGEDGCSSSSSSNAITSFVPFIFLSSSLEEVVKVEAEEEEEEEDEAEEVISPYVAKRWFARQ